ncbi:anti-sigma factor antagonist [Mycolicibacterium sp. GF69]|uniref:STAS domain-containing protein n=1 Tax=Mycolicibacterium sp. GF69 TaxID=2267251 RepID=UPI000DCB895F|nr:STAS domain-containing protein [Mycolicibacterium sp. GF69]RAV18166.1 anti-sigma factor antagonist [Mycolicibacterium sp. GF69]
MKLILSCDVSGRSTRIDIVGDLDYGHTGQLLKAVAALLSNDTRLRDLHLDFTELAFLDSTGLSELLQVHRKASSLGVRLHLDNRPAHLDRVLDITGTLEYLSSGPRSDAGRPDGTEMS